MLIPRYEKWATARKQLSTRRSSPSALSTIPVVIATPVLPEPCLLVRFLDTIACLVRTWVASDQSVLVAIHITRKVHLVNFLLLAPLLPSLTCFLLLLLLLNLSFTQFLAAQREKRPGRVFAPRTIAVQRVATELRPKLPGLPAVSPSLDHCFQRFRGPRKMQFDVSIMKLTRCQFLHDQGATIEPCSTTLDQGATMVACSVQNRPALRRLRRYRYPKTDFDYHVRNRTDRHASSNDQLKGPDVGTIWTESRLRSLLSIASSISGLSRARRRRV